MSSRPWRPPDPRTVRRAVERWSSTYRRPLPWRGERDPYRVLVSEVMLQQTQAPRVAKAYPVFIGAFPTARKLAGAGSSDVLRAWGGLGYNRRALALWRACRMMRDEGGFPRSVAGLERLPGVGPYTARAVASFAFGADVGVVDTNVRRVVTRVFGLDAGSDVQHIADRLVPRGGSPRWNQLMIDLGALVCRARTPDCERCPLSRCCAWHAGICRPRRPRRPSPPFVRTSRYVRGRIVAELRRSPLAIDPRVLAGRVGVARSRFDGALEGLERDGIVSVRNGRVRLGASERATEGRPRPRRGTASRGV